MKKLLILLVMGMTLTAGAQQAHKSDTTKCEKCGQGAAHKKKGGMHFELKQEDREAFKALLDEYRQERNAVREKYHVGKAKKDTELTEAEMDANMRNRFACRKALLALNEKYYAKFRKMLPPCQAARVLQPGKGHGQFHKGQKHGKGMHGKPVSGHKKDKK